MSLTLEDGTTTSVSPPRVSGDEPPGGFLLTVAISPPRVSGDEPRLEDAKADFKKSAPRKRG